MTSAWFDLSSRLQSNTVMLGRRKESPKSFLGKQRQLVTPGLVAGQVRRFYASLKNYANVEDSTVVDSRVTVREI